MGAHHELCAAVAARMAAGVVLALSAPAVLGAGLRVEPSLAMSLTATTNSQMQPQGADQKDLVLGLTPRLGFSGQGARVRLDGQVWLDALAYAREPRFNRILPGADLRGQATLVERWWFLEAGLRVEQSALDPFAAALADTSAANRITSSRLQLSPVLQHQFSPSLSVAGRLDLGWTRRSGTYLPGDARGDANTRHAEFTVERRPTPFGWALDLMHDASTLSGDSTDLLAGHRARARLLWKPDAVLRVAGLVGAETSRFGASDRTDTTYGLELEFTPTERDRLALTAEQRYFGTGLEATVHHRSPFVAATLRLGRRPTVTSNSLVLGAADSTADLLDAMRTTREPDPVLRAQWVRDVMSTYGLPTRLTQATEVYANVARLEQSADLTLMFMGRLTTVTLVAYARRLEPLVGADDPLGPDPNDTQSSRQLGLNLQVSRRLSARDSIDLMVGASDLRGLAAASQQRLRQANLSAGISHRLSSQSTLAVTLRHSHASSSASGVTKETALRVELSHRF